MQPSNRNTLMLSVVLAGLITLLLALGGCGSCDGPAQDWGSWDITYASPATTEKLSCDALKVHVEEHASVVASKKLTREPGGHVTSALYFVPGCTSGVLEQSLSGQNPGLSQVFFDVGLVNVTSMFTLDPLGDGSGTLSLHLAGTCDTMMQLEVR